MILRLLGRGILWGIRLLFLAWVLSIMLLPVSVAYDWAGWRWAILAGVLIFGIVGFLIKFGPWLLGRWVARSLAKAMAQDVDVIVDEVNSGLWNPMRRESVMNHAAAEGIEVSPNAPR